jgi:hypothetical protein
MEDYREIEDDDEFFGAQNDDEHDHFGGLSKYELQSKDEEMKNIGFLQSYDQTSELKLQEGFEAGYQETFESSFRIGSLLGRLAASKRLSKNKNNDTQSDEEVPSTAARHVRTFVASFQERVNKNVIKNAKAELEDFELELKSAMKR